METAVLSNATAVPPLPRTPAEIELAQVENKMISVNNKLATLKNQLALEESTMAAMTAQFNGACRDLAAGKDVDPEKYRVEMTKRSGRIQGFRDLLADAHQEHQPLAERHQVLTVLVAGEQLQAEVKRLEGLQIDAEEVWLDKVREAAGAEGLKNAATYALGQARRKLQAHREQRHLGRA